jgi:predicted nucleic acid-binding protein
VKRCGAMWSGAFGVPETVSDTGPILHLHEIGRLPLLAPFSPLVIPGLVQAELDLYNLPSAELAKAGVELTVTPVAEPIWKEILLIPGFSRIQSADAQVFAVARSCSFQALVLTDDLALRKLLERDGATVVGSFGLLIRAYRDGRLNLTTLERSVDDLLERSTLHLSRPFRSYVRKLIEELH